MSKNISLDEIKKFWPERAPDISIVQKYVKKYEKEKIVIKYGGNVLIDRNVFNNFISDINVLNRLGFSIIVVHGGGPRIKRELDKKKIVSKFINGLRVTDKNIIDRPNLFRTFISEIKLLNTFLSIRTFPPYLITIFSFLYFFTYFWTILMSGALSGQNSFISSREIFFDI